MSLELESVVRDIHAYFHSARLWLFVQARVPHCSACWLRPGKDEGPSIALGPLFCLSLCVAVLLFLGFQLCPSLSVIFPACDAVFIRADLTASLAWDGRVGTVPALPRFPGGLELLPTQLPSVLFSFGRLASGFFVCLSVFGSARRSLRLRIFRCFPLLVNLRF